MDRRQLEARVGILYPGHAAEKDYALASSIIRPHVTFEVVHAAVADDAHREAALRDVGSMDHLMTGALELRRRRVDAAVWACTSASFVFGLEGAKQQARCLQQVIGVPVSSTALAFIAAVHALGLRRVSVAATYPADIADMFVNFLEVAAIRVVGLSCLDIMAAADVATASQGETLCLVASADRPDAEAILVPDTALHSISYLDRLEEVMGKIILTANQVTIWIGRNLAGLGEVESGPGYLFHAAPRYHGQVPVIDPSGITDP